MPETFADTATATQDDYVIVDWLVTPEGWKAQAEILDRYEAVEELIARTVDSEVPQLSDFIPASYARPNTQLMLI